MRGFTFVDSTLKHHLKDEQIPSLQVNYIQNEKFALHRQTVNKFLTDKVFYDDAAYTLVLDGVLFNDKALISKYKKQQLADTLLEMYRLNGENFFKELKGSFSGVFVDKHKDLQVFFTSPIGDHPVYYFASETTTIVSSRIATIVAVLKTNKISYSIDKVGAYSMLTHGYMLGDYTLITEIKKIPAGHYLRVQKGSKALLTYFSFSNKINNQLTEKATIARLDDLFLKAVNSIVEKNRTHQFTNYVSLSAGLDTRIINFALQRIGEADVVNFSYSQAGHFDEVIPKKIASDLARQWMFKPLDDGLSIQDNIDEIIEINDGMVLYFGPGQVSHCFDLFNETNLGLISTGMLGGSVVSIAYANPHVQEYSLHEGANSTRFIPKLSQLLPDSFLAQYPNIELFKLYNRLFNGANFGAPLTYLQKSISFSPFYDVDFLSFCLSIPAKYRLHNYIYDRWIAEKYPDAAKYLHNGTRKIGQQPFVFKGKPYYFTSFKSTLKAAFRKIGLSPQLLQTKNHMNPLDYWYETNNELKTYMDVYFATHIKKVADEEIKRDCTSLYKDGNTIEKTQVLTLLGAIQKFFS